MESDEDSHLRDVLETSRKEEEARRQEQLKAEEEQSRKERHLLLESEMQSDTLRRQRENDETEAEEQMRFVMEASVRDERERQERLKNQRAEELARMEREFGTRSKQAGSPQGISRAPMSPPTRIERITEGRVPERNAAPASRAASVRSSQSGADGGRSEQQVSNNSINTQRQIQVTPRAQSPENRRQSTTRPTLPRSRNVEPGQDFGLRNHRPTSRIASLNQTGRWEGLARSQPREHSSDAWSANSDFRQPHGLDRVWQEYPDRNETRGIPMNDGSRDDVPPARGESLVRNGLGREFSTAQQIQDSRSVGPNARPRNEPRRQSSVRPQREILLRTRTIHEASRNIQASRRPDSSDTQPPRWNTDQIQLAYNASTRSSPQRRNTIQGGNSTGRSHMTIPGSFIGATTNSQNQNTDDFDDVPEHILQRTMENEPRAQTDDEYQRQLDLVMRASTTEAYRQPVDEGDQTRQAIANSLGDPDREPPDPHDLVNIIQGESPRYHEIWKDEIGNAMDPKATYRLAGICGRDPEHPDNEEEIVPVPFEFRMISMEVAIEMRSINPNFLMYLEDGRAKWDDEYGGIPKPRIIPKREAAG